MYAPLCYCLCTAHDAGLVCLDATTPMLLPALPHVRLESMLGLTGLCIELARSTAAAASAIDVAALVRRPLSQVGQDQVDDL